jgi:PadR family transcriptional regulator PadR
MTPERKALLRALLDGEGFGLALVERVRVLTGGRVQLGQATVYPMLREMEAEGLLESREADPLPERGGRPRRYYRLTKAGRDAAG